MSASIPLHGYSVTPLSPQTDDLSCAKVEDSSHQPSKQLHISTAEFSTVPESKPHPIVAATALRPRECDTGSELPEHADSTGTIRIKTLLYSSVVVYLLTLLGFGYDIGFSSPALHDLSQNDGKHTYFNRTIYRDAFNVSE